MRKTIAEVPDSEEGEEVELFRWIWNKKNTVSSSSSTSGTKQESSQWPLRPGRQIRITFNG